MNLTTSIRGAAVGTRALVGDLRQMPQPWGICPGFHSAISI